MLFAASLALPQSPEAQSIMSPTIDTANMAKVSPAKMTDLITSFPMCARTNAHLQHRLGRASTVCGEGFCGGA